MDSVTAYTFKSSSRSLSSSRRKEEIHGHDPLQWLLGPRGFPARGHSKFLAIKAQVKMDIELEANDARCRWCSEDR